MSKTSKELSSASRKRGRPEKEKQFPGKLHDMMTYVEQKGLRHIVSWIHDGRGFMVHDSKKLVEILPLFFRQTQYKSFARQVNSWHFQRVLDGSSKGAFVHPYFLRGHKLLCEEMSRCNKPPLSSFPIRSTQLEAPWHITDKIGESWVKYLSRGAISSPSFSCESSGTLVHDSGAARNRFLTEGPHGDAGLTLQSSNGEVDSDRGIQAKKGEQREFRDGALTYFAGRQFFFVDVLDEDCVHPAPLLNEEKDLTTKSGSRITKNGLSSG